MSKKQIDYRVVEMEFDNVKFAKNIDSTMKQLDDLEKHMDLSTSAQKMSASSEIIIGALRKIGEEIVDVGMKLAKGIVLDPLIKGMASYEEQINSVQVIMNATGDTMANVERIMGRLVWFADETSYSMDQMSNAAGRFVSNNIPLEQAATAIQGIANMAALAGVQGQHAAIAFNNISDAIAKGALTAIDYKSLELAQITTTEFKKTAIEAAKAVGTLGENGEILQGRMKGLIVTTTNFKETLSDQASGMWFTNDVIMKQADAFGNYATAVAAVQDEFDTFKIDNTANAAMEVVDAIQASGDAALYLQETFGFAEKKAKDLAAVIDTNSGKLDTLGKKAFLAAQESKTLSDSLNYMRDALASSWAGSWKLIFGNYEEAKVVFTGLSDLLYEVFVSSGDARNEMLAIWKDEGGRDAFLLSLDVLVHHIKQLVAPIKEAFRNIFPPMTGKRLAEISKEFLKLVASFKMEEETADKLRRTFQGLFAVVDIGVSFIKELLKFVGKVVGVFSPATSGVLGLTAGVGDFLTSVRDTIKEGKMFEGFFDLLLTGIKKVKEFLAPVGEILRNVFGNLSNVLGGLGTTLKEIFVGDGGATTFTEKIKKALSGLFEWLKSIGKKLSGVFVSVEQKIREVAGVSDSAGLKEIIKGLLKRLPTLQMITTQIRLLFTNIGDAFAKISPVLQKAWSIIGPIFKELIDFVGRQLEGLDLAGALSLINSILNIGLLKTLMKLTGAVSDNLKAFEQIQLAIAGVIRTFQTTLKAFNFSLYAKGIQNIAIAIGILVAALIALSFIDSKKLIDSLIILTIVMAEVVGAMILLSKIPFGQLGMKKMIGIGAGMAGMSVGVLLLAAAMKILSKIDGKALVTGLAVITIMLVELSLSMKLLSSSQGGMMKAAAGMLILSIALLTMAGAIKLYSVLNFTMLMKGLAKIGVTLIMLGVAMRAFPTSGLIKASIALGILSGAILGIAGAIAVYSKIPFDMMLKGLGGIAATLVILGLALKFINTNLKEAASIMILAVAMTALAVPVIILSKLDLKSMGVGLLGLAVSVGLMIIAVRSLKGKGAEVASLAALIAAFAAFAAGFKILSAAMKNIDLPTFVKSIAAVGMITLMIKALSGSKKQVGNALKVATAMATILIVVAAVFFLMSEFSNIEKVQKIAISIGGVMLSMAAVVKIISTIGAKKMNKALTALTVLTLLLVPLAAIITMMTRLIKNSSSLIPATVALGALMLALGATVKIIATIHGNKKMDSALKALSIVTLLMAPLGAVLTAMSYFTQDPIGMIPIATSLGLLAIALGATIKILGTIDGKMAEGALLSMAIVTLLMAPLGAVLTAMSLFVVDPTTLIPIALALGVLANALAVAVLILGQIDEGITGSAAATTAMLVILMAPLGAIIGWLSGAEFVNVENIIPIAVALGLLAIELSAAVLVLSQIKEMSVGVAVKAILVMIILVAAVAALMVGLGLLAEHTSLLEGGVQALTLVGQAIGGFIGGILGGIVEGAMSSLPQIGTYLSDFITNAQGFIDGVGQFNQAVLSAVGTLVLVIIELTAAKLIEGIAKFLVGGLNFNDLAENLVSLGEALTQFQESTLTVDPIRIVMMAAAVSAIMNALSEAPNSGGLVELFTGGNDAKDIGKSLAKFGEYFAKFDENVKVVEPMHLILIARAMKDVFLALKEAPNSGGLVELFTGGNDAKDIGKSLAKFGEYFAKFDENVVGINIPNLLLVADAMKRLFLAMREAPNSGGLVSLFTGDNTGDVVGQQLASFGSGLKTFSINVQGLDHESLRDTAKSMVVLFDALKKAPNTGGLVSLFTGDNTGDVVGQQLASFGMSLRMFAIAVTGLDHESILQTADTMVVLFETLKKAPNDGGLIGEIVGNNGGDLIGQQLAVFGLNLKLFEMHVKGLDNQAILDAADTMMILFETLSDAPNQGGLWQTLVGGGMAEQLMALGQGLQAYANYMTPGTIQAIIDSGPAITAFTDILDTLNQIDITTQTSGVIEKLIESITSGFTNAETQNELQIKMEAVIESFLSAFTSASTLHAVQIAASKLFTSDQFVPSGQNIVQGLIRGIAKDKHLLNTAVVTMSQEMITALNRSLDSHSPSKVTEEIGGWVTKGLIRGVKKDLKQVYGIGESLGGALEDGVRDATDIHSFGELFPGIGTNSGEGIIHGAKQTLDDLKNTGKEMAGKLIGGVVGELDIELPEGITRYFSGSVESLDELFSEEGEALGDTLVGSISSGIRGSNAGEEAAKEKAQRIVDAFAKGLSRLSHTMSVLDAEFSLFEKSFGFIDPDDELALAAKELAVNERELELTRNKLALQTDIAAQKEEKYKLLLAAVGEETEETRQAQLDYLAAQGEVLDMMYRIDELQHSIDTHDGKSEEARSKKMADWYAGADRYNQEYAKLMEHFEMLQASGLTEEDIAKSAQRLAGWDPEGYRDKADRQIEASVVDSMKTVSEVIGDNIMNTLGENVEDHVIIGKEYTMALGHGMTSMAPYVNNATMTMIETLLTEIRETETYWFDAGAFLVAGFIKGMESQMANAGLAAGAVAAACYRAIMAMLGIESPSTKGIEAGMWLVKGIAIGLLKYSHMSEVAAENVALSTIDTLRDTLSKISDYVDADMDINPTITPVIDLEATKKQVNALNSMLNQSIGITTAIDKTTRIASTRKRIDSDPANQNGNGSKETSVTFNQYNTSPKELSRIDIYRDTKNLVSTLKGRVNK